MPSPSIPSSSSSHHIPDKKISIGESLDIGIAEQINENTVECVIDKLEVSNNITESASNNIIGLETSSILRIEPDQPHVPSEEEEGVSNGPS
jgi:hypothetical protein